MWSRNEVITAGPSMSADDGLEPIIDQYSRRGFFNLLSVDDDKQLALEQY